MANVEVGGARICAAARALVGAPFRLYGRGARTGVDCVGLALLSVRAAGFSVPDPAPYRLRTGVHAPLANWMAAAGLVRCEDRPVTGDILLAAVAPTQVHLLVDGGNSVIHAHAGLRRVVDMPMPAEWAVLSRWRPAILMET